MKKFVWSFWVGMVLVGIWSTAGHYFAPLPPPELLETGNIIPGREWFLEQLPLYKENWLITALHVVPSFLFMSLILLQLSPRIRKGNIAVHRWIGRLFVLSAISIAISGLLLGIIMPFGGAIETAGVVVMSIAFLYFLFMGVLRIRQRRVTEHRYWMLNMVALAFAPITMRMVITVVMLSTSYSGPTVFGPAMWIAMVINLFVLHRFILDKRPQHDVLQASAVSQ